MMFMKQNFATLTVLLMGVLAGVYWSIRSSKNEHSMENDATVSSKHLSLDEALAKVLDKDHQSARPRELTDAELEELFANFDEDNNGKISKEELTGMFKALELTFFDAETQISNYGKRHGATAIKKSLTVDEFKTMIRGMKTEWETKVKEIFNKVANSEGKVGIAGLIIMQKSLKYAFSGTEAERLAAKILREKLHLTIQDQITWEQYISAQPM
eukprot:gnl/MRDRNA2_/MRDRNA2_26188_c0_seq2.p1 gnl/MRDRNA2_/MRDRNA2_26188_c0~~gnl/MRDRNA2_/MRDRNA2_26188_c0_seq2.p1  ORF type:complete len:214 (-),score=43.36 gnl/MRDRNA2_/MRDRNA2_26188_c0_seq2:295-936(-)